MRKCSNLLILSLVTVFTNTKYGLTSAQDCVDDVLGGPWGAGGTFNCDTYANSNANCLHVDIKNACCFCGGGGSPPAPTPTISEECVDDVLGGPWGSDGTFNCDTYANSDQNCLHDEIKNACCFCGGGGPPPAPTPPIPSSPPSEAKACIDGELDGSWGADGTFDCDTYANSDQNCLHDEINTKCCFCGGGYEPMSIKKVIHKTKPKGKNLKSIIKVALTEKVAQVDIELVITLTYPNGNVDEEVLTRTTNQNGVATFSPTNYVPPADVKVGFVSAVKPGFQYFEEGNNEDGNGCKLFTSDCPIIEF